MDECHMRQGIMHLSLLQFARSRDLTIVSLGYSAENDEQ